MHIPANDIVWCAVICVRVRFIFTYNGVMAQFCHDQYDHPLLWCDQKRRAEERRIASESLAVAQQRKEEQDSYRTREIHEVSDAVRNLEISCF